MYSILAFILAFLGLKILRYLVLPLVKIKEYRHFVIGCTLTAIILFICAIISVFYAMSYTEREASERLERELSSIPYKEVQIESARLLEEKDFVFLRGIPEDYLLEKKDLKVIYFETKMDYGFEDKEYRVPAYLNVADVKEPYVRFQMMDNMYFNAVLTVPHDFKWEEEK